MKWCFFVESLRLQKRNIKTSQEPCLFWEETHKGLSCLQDHPETIDGTCPPDAFLFCQPGKHRKVPLWVLLEIATSTFWYFSCARARGCVLRLLDLLHSGKSSSKMVVDTRGSHRFDHFSRCLHLFWGLSMDFPIAWQVHESVDFHGPLSSSEVSMKSWSAWKQKIFPKSQWQAGKSLWIGSTPHRSYED